MAGTREQQKQARREAIFRAAATLFAERGYGATTVEDIARAAGVTVPTFYAYVPSKADLVAALYESDRALIDARKQALIARPARDPARAVCALLLLEMKDHQDWLGHAVWRDVVATAIRGGGDFQGRASLSRYFGQCFIDGSRQGGHRRAAIAAETEGKAQRNRIHRIHSVSSGGR